MSVNTDAAKSVAPPPARPARRWVVAATLAAVVIVAIGVYAARRDPAPPRIAVGDVQPAVDVFGGSRPAVQAVIDRWAKQDGHTEAEHLLADPDPGEPQPDPANPHHVAIRFTWRAVAEARPDDRLELVVVDKRSNRWLRSHQSAGPQERGLGYNGPTVAQLVREHQWLSALDPDDERWSGSMPSVQAGVDGPPLAVLAELPPGSPPMNDPARDLLIALVHTEDSNVAWVERLYG